MQATGLPQAPPPPPGAFSPGLIPPQAPGQPRFPAPPPPHVSQTTGFPGGSPQGPIPGPPGPALVPPPPPGMQYENNRKYQGNITGWDRKRARCWRPRGGMPGAFLAASSASVHRPANTYTCICAHALSLLQVREREQRWIQKEGRERCVEISDGGRKGSNVGTQGGMLVGGGGRGVGVEEQNQRGA